MFFITDYYSRAIVSMFNNFNELVKKKWIGTTNCKNIWLYNILCIELQVNELEKRNYKFYLFSN